VRHDAKILAVDPPELAQAIHKAANAAWYLTSTAVPFMSTPIRRIGAPSPAMKGGVVGQLLSRPKLIPEGIRQPPPIGEVE